MNKLLLLVGLLFIFSTSYGEDDDYNISIKNTQKWNSTIEERKDSANFINDLRLTLTQPFYKVHELKQIKVMTYFVFLQFMVSFMCVFIYSLVFDIIAGRPLMTIYYLPIFILFEMVAAQIAFIIPFLGFFWVPIWLIIKISMGGSIESNNFFNYFSNLCYDISEYKKRIEREKEVINSLLTK